MPVALSIVVDEFGATAIISGSELLADNTLHVQRFSGNLGAGTWQPAASRQGDGPLSLELPAGFYWAHVASEHDGNAACSNLVYFHVDDATAPVHYRCLQAVQSVIRSLALDGISPDSVLVRKLATDRDVGQNLHFALPCIQITPHSAETMPLASGTNLRDDVIYRVLITILVADNQNAQIELERYLGWRQRIARAFRNQPLLGLPEIYQCEITPHDVVSSEAWLRHNLFCSALQLQFHSREPRGSIA